MVRNNFGRKVQNGRRGNLVTYQTGNEIRSTTTIANDGNTFP